MGVVMVEEEEVGRDINRPGISLRMVREEVGLIGSIVGGPMTMKSSSFADLGARH